MDLAYLSNCPKGLQDVNSKIVCLIEAVKDIVDETDNLPVKTRKANKKKEVLQVKGKFYFYNKNFYNKARGNFKVRGWGHRQL